MVGKPRSIPNEEEVLERAKELRATGKSWRAVAEWLNVGVGSVWLQRRLVPGFAERANERNAMSRLERATGEPLPIPLDTRSITARVFGDPLPGRSALDKKRAEAAA
ncbi:MAG: hypothetical protein AAGF48_12975 [Pseudomonadota bacterium]